MGIMAYSKNSIFKNVFIYFTDPNSLINDILFAKNPTVSFSNPHPKLTSLTSCDSLHSSQYRFLGLLGQGDILWKSLQHGHGNVLLNLNEGV